MSNLITKFFEFKYICFGIISVVLSTFILGSFTTGVFVLIAGVVLMFNSFLFWFTNVGSPAEDPIKEVIISIVVLITGMIILLI